MGNLKIIIKLQLEELLMAEKYAGRIIKLYKRTEDGKELIALFANRWQAVKYSVSNKIMNERWVNRTLEENTWAYPDIAIKYPEASNYRFEVHDSPVFLVREDI